jgi:hypothetical protein
MPLGAKRAVARVPNDFDLTDGLLPAVCGSGTCVQHIICWDVLKSAYSSGGLLQVWSQIDDPFCLASRALYLTWLSNRNLNAQTDHTPNISCQ